MSKVYDTLLGMTRNTTLFNYAQRVIDWNDIARRARGGEFTDPALQWGFVQEEFNETVAALREGDRVEVVDGACDMFVVASYAHFLSSQCGNYWVQELKRLCEYNSEINFSLIDLERAVYETKNVITALKHVVALLFRLDINLEYNLTEVLSSNDSKYPTVSELLSFHPGKTLNGACDEECLDIEQRSNGRYKGVVFRLVDDRIVFFDENGKILKPVTFVSPEIIV